MYGMYPPPYWYPPPNYPQQREPRPMSYKQYRKMTRRWERDSKEKESSKKPNGKKGVQLGMIEMFAMLCVFGLPVGSVWLIAMNNIAKQLIRMIPN